MTRFADVLQETAQRLTLPQPTKARVLLELAGDMEGLYELKCADGLSDAEAHNEVVLFLRPSEDAIADLIAMHTGSFRKLLDGLSVTARTRAERGFLFGLSTFVLSIIVVLSVTNGLLAQTTVLVWPALGLATAGICLGAWKGGILWLVQDHDPRRLRRGLSSMLLLAISSVLFAFSLPLFESRAIASSFSAEPAGATRLAEALAASAATIVVALMSALLCSLIWYALNRKVSRIELSEVA